MDKIIGYANSKNSNVRERVIEALGILGGREASAVIVATISDRSPFVRLAGIRASSMLNTDDKRVILEHGLRDSYSVARIDALEGLAEMDLDYAQRAAIHALTDKDWLVRGKAVALLGEIGTHIEKDVLEQRLLSEHSYYVRLNFWYALYLLGDKKHFSDIIGALRTKSYRARCLAANILTRISDRENAVLIQQRLNNALQRENTVAGREAIQKSLNQILNQEHTN